MGASRGDADPRRSRRCRPDRRTGTGRDSPEEREQHLETVIDNLPGYVYRHTHEQGYPLVFVKGDAESVTGYTTAELEDEVGLAEEVIHPADRDDIWEQVLEALEQTGQFDLTYRIERKDGTVQWIRDQGQILTDPVTGAEVVDGFITQAKQPPEDA